MPPRSYSYTSGNHVSYDDQFSETDVDTDAKYIYTPIAPSAKSVCFSDLVEVVLVERIDDFTEEEISAVWYNDSDFQKMKHEIQMLVQLMEIGVDMPSSIESTRGLEHRTRKGALLKFHNKRSAYCAVLDEQDNQWKRGVFDCDAISKVYTHHTAICQEVAAQIGRRDAVAARKVHQFSPINKFQNRRK